MDSSLAPGSGRGLRKGTRARSVRAPSAGLGGGRAHCVSLPPIWFLPSPQRAARGLRWLSREARAYKRGDRPEPQPSSPRSPPLPTSSARSQRLAQPRRADGWASLAQDPPSPSRPARAWPPIGRQAGSARRRSPPLPARARKGRQGSAGCRREGARVRGGRLGDAAAVGAAALGSGRNLCLPPRPAVRGARAPRRFPGRWARGGQDGGPAGRGAAGTVLRAAVVGDGGPRRGPGARRVRLGGAVGGWRAGGGRGHGRGRRGRAEEGAGAARGGSRALREPAHLGRRVWRIGPGQRRESLLQHVGRLALLLGRLLGRRTRAPRPRAGPRLPGAWRPHRAGVGGGRGWRGLELHTAGPPAPALRRHWR